MRKLIAAWESVLGAGAHVSPLDYAGDRAWVVIADDGRAYILKRFVTIAVGEPLHRLVCEQRVLSHLAARGVPVSERIIADDGRVCATDADGSLYVLSPRLPGGKVDPEDLPSAGLVYRRIGEAFGLLHKALAEFPWKIPSYVVVADEQLTPESLEWLFERDESLARKVERGSPAVVSALDTLPRQLIHGDPHDGNILLHEDRVTAFIDIDHLPVGPRIGDLARYLANRMMWAIDAPDDRMAAFRELVSSMLDGYDSVNPLLPNEPSAIWPALLLRALSNASWCHSQGDTESTYYTDSLRIARWIADL